ncbi:unnamed protein product [Eruca vesicaria subsp. sativa]|uniref:Uncharacterized protein n=1 Tax=Eruca vesicaria subsp. sativa TaxID=29727 RepID=A0ABC8J551_ERUVS|nr:unnamed protein product [Eruca vesicaria subsp. sativa]
MITAVIFWENDTLQKSICYMSDIDEDNRMKREIHSGEVSAKSCGKPCSKSKYNSKHCKYHLIPTEFDCSLYQQADRDSNLITNGVIFHGENSPRNYSEVYRCRQVLLIRERD